MEGGRISDVGTHDELMRRSAIYRETYTSQNKMGTDESDVEAEEAAQDEAATAANAGAEKGGSALHMNLEEHLSKEQYRQLLRVAAIEGCNYFTFNIPNTICNECKHIDKRYLHECPECHSRNVDYLTRVIGYMKRISNFSQARQKEAAQRYYAPLR